MLKDFLLIILFGLAWILILGFIIINFGLMYFIVFAILGIIFYSLYLKSKIEPYIESTAKEFKLITKKISKPFLPTKPLRQHLKRKPTKLEAELSRQMKELEAIRKWKKK